MNGHSRISIREAVGRLPALVALMVLSGCHLYSLQDGCGPLYDGGSTCVIPTTGSGTSGGTATTGTGTGGTSTGGTTGTPPCNANGLPCAPASVQATAAKSSADLTWTPASGNGSMVTGYIVTANPSGGPGALNLGAVTAAVFPSLTPGTSYKFSVVALNANGQGPAGLSNAVVPFDVPGAPTNVTVDAGQSSVVVSWTAAPGNGLPITGYTVTAMPGPQMAVSDGGDTTATVTGLTDFTSYTFSVVAQNDAGVGPAAMSSAATPFILVSTLAGTGDAGWVDGPGNGAAFTGPTGVAIDAQGFVYVAENGGHRIRKIAPDGTTSLLAGNGDAGDAEGQGVAAAFNYPIGVAVDTNGFVYVGDQSNHKIRKIAPDGTTTTLAGDGDAGYLDGMGSTAQFSAPGGVAVDPQGNVYVADTFNFRIRKVAPDGTTSTLAGNGDAGYVDGTGGPAGTTEFLAPFGVAVDTLGAVYVADTGSNRIRKIATDGTTSTLAGNGDAGSVDGTGGPTGAATFHFPYDLGVDPQGYVYIGDSANHRIRKIAPDGTTSTIAGVGFAGFSDGVGGPDGGAFNFPFGIAADGQGHVFVGEYLNQRVRKISQ
jgi:sugar lactone lactonase YvrE